MFRIGHDKTSMAGGRPVTMQIGPVHIHLCWRDEECRLYDAPPRLHINTPLGSIISAWPPWNRKGWTQAWFPIRKPNVRGQSFYLSGYSWDIWLPITYHPPSGSWLSQRDREWTHHVMTPEQEIEFFAQRKAERMRSREIRKQTEGVTRGEGTCGCRFEGTKHTVHDWSTP